MRAIALAVCLAAAAGPSAAETVDLQALQSDLQRVEALLGAWQITEARTLAERLLHAHPDLPAVQLGAAWVKFHLGEHRAALELAERAAAAFGGQLERDERLGMIRAAARVSGGFSRHASPDGRVVVWFEPGVDEVILPDVIDAVTRTLQTVGQDLGHRPDHPIPVQLLPDDRALSDMTGLRVDEIRTSGTIAVCKFGRLMIISPRATLRGFSYLDTASHELVHLIISQKTFNRTPIWIHEALAKYEETRWRSDEPLFRPGLHPARASRLARALRTGELIPFERMHPSMALLPSQEAAELAFCEVYTVTAFLLDRKGYAGLRRLLELLGAGRSDFEAIAEVYGLDRAAFERSWLAYLRSMRLVELAGDDGDLDRSERRSAGERRLARSGRVDLRDRFHLGQLFRARGRSRAAVVELARARDEAGSEHAGSFVIQDKLGLALASLGRSEEARAAFEASLAVHPNDLDAHLHLGGLLVAQQPYRAFLHLREALRLNPVDPRVHRALVAAARKLAAEGDGRADWKALAARHERSYRITARYGAGAGRTVGVDRPGPEGEISTLRVMTRPWARLWLDFEPTGLTSPVYALEVEAGWHLLGLDADCLKRPWVEWIELRPGQTFVLDMALCEQPEGP
ncbi:MAG: tetratricopeptide repeat protein [Deltaproteobacteria bacterium]|nr:tetratricopeptide repeat protein [Deltaproteobacteria bacterium]